MMFVGKPISTLARPGHLRALTAKATASRTADDEVRAARRWLAEFSPDTIPKRICELSFSRSSGPGGQNVNKVNSKATMRVPLEPLFAIVPSLLHPEIRAHRTCSQKAGALIIQTEDSRKQSDNIQGCFRKLHDLIVEAGTKTVPGETSDAQRQRVKDLATESNEVRIRAKKSHSSKKSARQSGRSDD